MCTKAGHIYCQDDYRDDDSGGDYRCYTGTALKEMDGYCDEYVIAYPFCNEPDPNNGCQ